MHSQATTTARAATATWGFTSAYTARLRKIRPSDVEIFAIYQRHRHYRAFSGPTATPGCFVLSS